MLKRSGGKAAWTVWAQRVSRAPAARF